MTFQEAFDWQVRENNSYNDIQCLETGVEVIDKLQFSVGNIVWVILADNFQLDDYEEWVSQRLAEYWTKL